MNRNEWKTLYRRMRSNRRAGKYSQSEMLDHGRTYWTAHLFANGSDKGLHLAPSIIRDRSITSRVASELAWARRFRLEARNHRRNGTYYAPHAYNSIKGAKACLFDGRTIRLDGSIFHAWN